MSFEAIKAKAAEAKKVADAAKGRDRQPVYKQKFNPGTLGTKGGYDPRGRFGESRGYDYVRAMAVAMRAIPIEDAKEEVETDRFLRDTLKMQGFNPSQGHRGFLAVGSSRLLPTTIANGQDWHEMKSFQKDIRAKIFAASSTAMDLDHPDIQSWLSSKSLSEQTRIKTMVTSSDTSGGTLVPAPAQGEFIDLQRNFEAFSRAGSRELPLPPQGRISLPKQTGGSTAYWVGDPNSGLTLSDLTTGSLYLEAKLLGVLTNVSDQLMRFSDPQVAAMIRYDQAMQAGLAADTAMFTGTGGTQIKGLLTYPTSSSWTQGTDAVILLVATTVGTDGNTIQPQDLIKMSQILPDPVQQMPKNYLIYTPTSQFIMAKRADAVSAADQAGPFVFQINRDPQTGLPNGVYGNGLVTSYNVPANRVKGSGTNLTVIVCGAFQDWIIGRSGVVEFDTNPYTNFANVQTQMRTIEYIDAGPRHLASFSYIDTILPTT